MNYARAHLVDSLHGGFYHCISRCVRRGWLCGLDRVSGNSFEHRRSWIEARILLLADIFSIEVFAYAVMSNHYHLVLDVQPQKVSLWSDEEVVQRWLRLSSPNNESPEQTQIDAQLLNPERVALLRQRLGSLSWFMRYLNEPIARQANREDGCTGRFWEGRFKSIALLDEAAIVACMAYVDMNPIRAKLTQRIEQAPYTSVKRRVEHTQHSSTQLGELDRVGITLNDYVDVLRWTLAIDNGNMMKPTVKTSTTLKQFERSPDDWLGQVKVNRFKYRAYGASQRLKRYAQDLGQQWIKCSKYTWGHP